MRSLRVPVFWDRKLKPEPPKQDTACHPGWVEGSQVPSCTQTSGSLFSTIQSKTIWGDLLRKGGKGEPFPRFLLVGGRDYIQ